MGTNKKLTVVDFISFFRTIHGWECEEKTRIHNELTEFAKEREGSDRNIDELYVIFCTSKGLKPYPNKYDNRDESILKKYRTVNKQY